MEDDLERINQLLALVIHTIDYCAEQEQRITHSAHPNRSWINCLDILRTELEGNRAKLMRIRTVGR